MSDPKNIKGLLQALIKRSRKQIIKSFKTQDRKLAESYPYPCALLPPQHEIRASTGHFIHFPIGLSSWYTFRSLPSGLDSPVSFYFAFLTKRVAKRNVLFPFHPAFTSIFTALIKRIHNRTQIALDHPLNGGLHTMHCASPSGHFRFNALFVTGLPITTGRSQHSGIPYLTDQCEHGH